MWFKRHPDLLQKVCDELESDSNYKEYYRNRDNLLLSTGEILVRLEKTYKYPILIIFEKSYPYTLPTIVLLSECLKKEELEDFCRKKSGDIINELNSLHKIEYLDFWHQNQNGTICLLDEDNLEKFGEFFSINAIINRIRDWIAGNKRGILPFDNQEVEIFVHFRNIDFTKNYLIPSTFLSPDFLQGEFYFIKVLEILVNRTTLFMGSVLIPQDANGILSSPILHENNLALLPEGINSPLELITKTDLIKRHIHEQLIIRGHFFYIYGELRNPIQDVEDLLKALGRGNKKRGASRLLGPLSEELFKLLQRTIYIAISFLNKRKTIQWQTFVLNKIDEKAITKAPILFDKSVDSLIKLLTDNYVLKAQYCSEFSDTQHHLRNTGRVDRDKVINSTVSIFGCGAIGSEIADIISKAGVGKMQLVDFDTMKSGNSIRHVLGINFIGVPKVYGLKININHHNPFIEVDPVYIDIRSYNLYDYMIENSIGISTMANDNTEELLNEQAIVNNVTMFYARSIRGGKAARIFRVIPTVDACFYCLSLYRLDNSELFTDIPADPSLPTIMNECNNPIRPASAADLKLISSLITQIILNFLLTKDMTKNHWIWSTEEIKDNRNRKIDPFKLHSSNIPPHPECPLCNRQQLFQPVIDSGVLSFMREEIKKDKKIETGGVLLGSIQDQIIKINFASDSGPKAKKTPTLFEKDIEYCQEYIDKKFTENGNSAAYIGEWHYHPSENNHPSNTDIKSLSNIANGIGYLTENPIMIIMSPTGETRCTVHPIASTYYTVKLTEE